MLAFKLHAAWRGLSRQQWRGRTWQAFSSRILTSRQPRWVTSGQWPWRESRCCRKWWTRSLAQTDGDFPTRFGTWPRFQERSSKTHALPRSSHLKSDWVYFINTHLYRPTFQYITNSSVTPNYADYYMYGVSATDLFTFLLLYNILTENRRSVNLFSLLHRYPKKKTEGGR